MLDKVNRHTTNVCPSYVPDWWCVSFICTVPASFLHKVFQTQTTAGLRSSSSQGHHNTCHNCTLTTYQAPKTHHRLTSSLFLSSLFSTINLALWPDRPCMYFLHLILFIIYVYRYLSYFFIKVIMYMYVCFLVPLKSHVVWIPILGAYSPIWPIAGLNVTSWWPCCIFVLYWPPTWTPCHVGENQEYRDMPLDEVWFFTSLPWTGYRYIISSNSVLIRGLDLSSSSTVYSNSKSVHRKFYLVITF